MKEFFIADAPRFENQAITSFFCLSSIGVRERKGGGGQYLALVLADRTGQFDARMWEEFADVLGSCSEGCYVKVQGQISRYQGKFQITLTRMRSATETEVEPGDFVPTTRFDVEAMAAELRGYAEAFENDWLRRLVLSFLDDPTVGPLFRTAPAAKRLHHAWIGGLLEHVLHLVRVCRATVPFYPEVNPDLLVSGAILHDIGKVRELAWGTDFRYTLEGQLIGHISIGQRMLADRITALNAEATAQAAEAGAVAELFPEPLRILLEHLLLAHHGKLEFGSPKLPMTPEALLLSTLDDLEAKFETMRGEFAAGVTAGRSPDQPTEWVRSMDRTLFDSRRYLETLKGRDVIEVQSSEAGDLSAAVDKEEAGPGSGNVSVATEPPAQPEIPQGPVAEAPLFAGIDLE